MGKQKKRKSYPYVELKWNDAHADNDFNSPKKLKKKHEPRVVTTVAIQYKRNKAGITIIRDYDDQGEGDGRLFVPAGMIVSVRRLGYKRS